MVAGSVCGVWGDLAFHAATDPVNTVPHDGIILRGRRYSEGLSAPEPGLDYLRHGRHCSDGGRAHPYGDEFLKVGA